MVPLPASPPRPRATSPAAPPSSPSQPFVPGNLPGTFPGLQNYSQHTPHSFLQGVPLTRGSINPANAIYGFARQRRRIQGRNFSTSRTGAPPLHQAPANLRVSARIRLGTPTDQLIHYPTARRRTQKHHDLQLTSAHARMPAPSFNYPKTFIYDMPPDGTGN